MTFFLSIANFLRGKVVIGTFWWPSSNSTVGSFHVSRCTILVLTSFLVSLWDFDFMT